MILTDKQIKKHIEEGDIVIDPFCPDCLGTNSYDVHLGKHLALYKDEILDAKRDNPTYEMLIPEEGSLLEPNHLYLGVTEEYTETKKHVPFLEGKSSSGRLGINIHATAGKGDVGFCNHWTLEISVIKAVRVYAGMPIAQLIYFTIDNDIQNLYSNKKNAKYIEQSNKPVGSMMWKNFLI